MIDNFHYNKHILYLKEILAISLYNYIHNLIFIYFHLNLVKIQDNSKKHLIPIENVEVLFIK